MRGLPLFLCNQHESIITNRSINTYALDVHHVTILGACEFKGLDIGQWMGLGFTQNCGRHIVLQEKCSMLSQKSGLHILEQ